MRPNIQQLTELIIKNAHIHLTPRFRQVSGISKMDGSLLTEADLAMDRAMGAELTRYWPDIGFLSEEMPPGLQIEALASDRPIWCLDPLDGTSNFAAGLPFYSVSLALIIDGKVDLGIIYDPERNECYTAMDGAGAWINGQVLETQPSTRELAHAVGIVDFKRLPKSMAKRLVCNPPYHSQRNLGSCALEWCWIAAGRGDFYLHGGMRLWDLAAGSLILAEAGGQALSLDGEAVFKLAAEPRSVVAAKDASLFTTLLETFSVPTEYQT